MGRSRVSLAIAALATACTGLPAADDSAQIVGHVYDIRTGARWMGPWSRARARDGHSHRDGRRGLPAGPWRGSTRCTRVSAVREGYLSTTATVTTDSRVQSADLRLPLAQIACRDPRPRPGARAMTPARSSSATRCASWVRMSCPAGQRCDASGSPAGCVVPVALTVKANGRGAVVSNPAGIDCGVSCAKNYQLGTVVHLVAAPYATADFLGWSGHCAGATRTCTVTMDMPHGAAQFTPNTNPQVTITVHRAGAGTGRITSSPAGIDCGTACNAHYDKNTRVSSSTGARGGSTFTAWSGACTGTADCTLTLAVAADVTATFQGISHTLTFLRGARAPGRSRRSRPASLAAPPARPPSAERR